LKTKITYIISNINKALAYEWIVEEIDQSIFELSFILLNNGNSFLEDYLIKSNIKVYRINYASKKNIPLTVLKIGAFLLKNKTDIVHANLFDANFSGLIAAKLVGIKKRIYTRHHSTYHHTYFPKAVKWDKLSNFLATDIVAISENVKHVLIDLENVPRQKITKIHHGFKIKEFSQKNTLIVDSLTKKYNPENKFPVIGVISRFIELKGVQYIIPAFRELLNKYPNALLLLFNATGDFSKQIDNHLTTLPENSFKKTTFENDIVSLYHLFDMFVHVPINNHCEAFGQTYIESMASGTPLIATKSGIGNEILIDGVNAIVVPYKNGEAIYKAMITILEDDKIKNIIIDNAKREVKNEFELATMITSIKNLYLKS